MRGKVKSVINGALHAGITPAYAGKSLSVSPARTVLRDHPRLCGEKDSLKIKQLSGVGSPPPMRGKGNFLLLCSDRHGITPAYAGKSSASRSFFRKLWDHPRLCGEKQLCLYYCQHQRGSPPPMRGKDFTAKSIHVYKGITPAYAGKSVDTLNELRDS